jgi:hypothetical protein
MFFISLIGQSTLQEWDRYSIKVFAAPSFAGHSVTRLEGKVNCAKVWKLL